MKSTILKNTRFIGTGISHTIWSRRNNIFPNMSKISKKNELLGLEFHLVFYLHETLSEIPSPIIALALKLLTPYSTLLKLIPRANYLWAWLAELMWPWPHEVHWPY